MARKGTAPADPTRGEVEVTFIVTPDEADILIQGLEGFAFQPHQDYEPVFEATTDADIAVAFASAIREQTNKPRIDSIPLGTHGVDDRENAT